MRRHLIVLAAFLSLLSPSAQAANSTVSAMTAASALGGTELLYVVQGAADRKGTPAQFATYIYGLASGDCTISGGGAVVCTKTNGVAFTSAATTAIGTSGATIPLLSTANTWTLGQTFSTAPTFGSITGSTQCLHVSSVGLVSGTGSDCGAGGSGVSSIAGNTGAFTLNSTSGITNATNDIKCQVGSSSQFGCVKVDGTTVTAASGIISAAPVSAVPSVQSGTNYAIVDGDRSKVIYLSNAAAQTPTLPSAATLTSPNGWFVTLCNIGAGIQTVTPTTSTIGGAATLAISGGSAARPVCWNAVSDGTNYSLVPAGNNNTIFSGTAAMGTSAIASGACATVVTVSAPGTATTDIAMAGFNGDPTATTGYLPTAMLTLIPYPTANNVNVKACNLTASSITPSALTLNIRVAR